MLVWTLWGERYRRTLAGNPCRPLKSTCISPAPTLFSLVRPRRPQYRSVISDVVQDIIGSLCRLCGVCDRVGRFASSKDFAPQRSRRAVDGGADRLEICSCLGIGGGLTPSLGLVRSIQRACPGVDIMVLLYRHSL